MASKILRSGNTPLLRNLIHRHLRPNPTTITAVAANQPGSAAVYIRNHLFPAIFGPRVESNQVVLKSSNGNQFALWAFTGLDHQSGGVQVHCRWPKHKYDSGYDSDDPGGKRDLDDASLSDFGSDSDLDYFSDSINVNDSDVE